MIVGGNLFDYFCAQQVELIIPFQRIKIHIRSPHKKSFHLSLRALEMDETVMEINAILLAIYGKIQIDFSPHNKKSLWVVNLTI